MLLQNVRLESILDNRRLTTTVIVAGVLLASAVLGQRASMRWLGLVVAGTGLLLLLRWPQLGLVGLVVATLSVPFAIGTGTQTAIPVTVPLLAALLGLWVMEMMLRREVRLVPSRTTLPLLLFLASVTLSFLAGTALWDPQVSVQTNILRPQLGGWAIFVLSGGAFLLAANRLTDERWLRAVTFTFIAWGTFLALGTVIPGLSRIAWRLTARGATGSLFWVWLIALAAGQSLGNPRQAIGWRVLMAVAVIAVMAERWFGGYGWVSGWAPPLAALAVIVWLWSPRWGVALGLAALAVVLLKENYFYTRIFVVAERTGSYQRFTAWREVLGLVRRDPIFGLGPANYWHYYRAFHSFAYGVFDPKVNSHNNYVDILAQTGLLGFGLFAWLIAEIGAVGWKLRNHFDEGFRRGYVYGALGGLAGTLAAGMLGDWFLPFVYNVGFKGFRASVLGWLFLGGLVALMATIRSRESVTGLPGER